LQSFADDLASALQRKPARQEELRRAIAAWRQEHRRLAGVGGGGGGGRSKEAATAAAPSWACAACTFVNEAEELRCGMCGTVKTGGTEKLQTTLAAFS
jgi:type II secretory pathway component PulJ